MSSIATDNLFVEPKREGVTLSVTLLWSEQSLFFNMFWNFTSKLLPLYRKQTRVSLLQSAEACLKTKPDSNYNNRSIMKHGTFQRWQLLQTRLDAIMIGCCQGDDTFVAFQPMGIFRFWRNLKFIFFPKMSTSWSSPSTSVKSSFLRWRPVLSRFYPRVQRTIE